VILLVNSADDKRAKSLVDNSALLLYKRIVSELKTLTIRDANTATIRAFGYYL